MEPYRDKRRHLPGIGLGRNCTLFEVTRRFAYTHRRVCPERALFTDIYAYAGQYNEKRFEYPLPVSEVKATARSVTKWVIKRMSDEGFQAWGDRRRQRSADVRHAKAEERAEQIQAYYHHHPAVTRKELALMFDVSEKTIQRLKIFRDR
jgi:transposase